MKALKLVVSDLRILFLMRNGEKNMMNYRHGDLSLIGIKNLPKDLEVTEIDIIMTGSHGNDHIVKNATLYLQQSGDFIVGYMVAKQGCILYHIEHGDKIEGKPLREAPIEPGIYELRKQCEDTNEGMKPVID